MHPQPIYLDNQATTPVHPEVMEAMQPYFTEFFGNPHSEGHAYGWMAANAMEQSRNEVAELIGADAREIVFTSGATESCNLAIRGVCQSIQKSGPANRVRRKIVTVATEHPCVLETCKDLAQNGHEVIILGVQPDGLVDLDEVRENIDKETLLVSVMAANNEIGVIQPVSEIAKICREEGAYIHTDATQAIGKIPVDVKTWGVDMLSLSGHKIYGPKGVGALYTKWDSDINIKPMTTGGGQEKGLRAGTAPVPLLVGLGKACQILQSDMPEHIESIKKLTSRIQSTLFQNCPEAILYGHPEKRIPGNINIGFPGYSGEEIVEMVSDYLAISTGSACSSTKVEPSPVLLALGVGAEAAQSTVRISIGRFNTEEDVDFAAKILSEAAGSTYNQEVISNAG